MLAVPRRVLVLDEPTAMLDPAGRDEVLAAVRREADRGLTVVLVTQEMDEVLLADRVVALAGRPVRSSTARRPPSLPSTTCCASCRWGCRRPPRSVWR